MDQNTVSCEYGDPPNYHAVGFHSEEPFAGCDQQVVRRGVHE